MSTHTTYMNRKTYKGNYDQLSWPTTLTGQVWQPQVPKSSIPLSSFLLDAGKDLDVSYYFFLY